MASTQRQRSSDRRRPERRRTTVSFMKLIKHLLLSGIYLPLGAVSAVGLLDWREDDWILLLVVCSASLGAHLTFLAMRFADWKNRQRSSSTMQVVG
jgi:hypothetical protein